MKKLSLLCATTALVMPATAFAQSTGSQDFEEEETIVITGSRVAGGRRSHRARHDQGQGGADLGSDRPPESGPDDPRHDQPHPGRQLPEQRRLRLVGRHAQHPRLLGRPHLADRRRHPAQRFGQLRDLLEPADRSGDHRRGQRQPRHHRRRQPDRLGGRRHRQLPHASSRARSWAALVVRLARRVRFPPRLRHDRDRQRSRPGAPAPSSPPRRPTNDNPFNNYGKVDKQQYNAKIYQPIGTSGDFVSIAGHYNQNRNNFFGSSPLRQDTTRERRRDGAAHRRRPVATTASR